MLASPIAVLLLQSLLGVRPVNRPQPHRCDQKHSAGSPDIKRTPISQSEHTAWLKVHCNATRSFPVCQRAIAGQAELALRFTSIKQRRRWVAFTPVRVIDFRFDRLCQRLNALKQCLGGDAQLRQVAGKRTFAFGGNFISNDFLRAPE